MYLRGSITPKDVFWASWRVLLIAGLWSSLVVYLREFLDYSAIALPTLPVTTVGVAVSLYLGFKSTSAYSRWWEARKIWGQIVNNSRIWANQARNLIGTEGGVSADDEEIRALVLRHLAWVNALAYGLRIKSRLKDSHRQLIFDYRLTNSDRLLNASPACYERYLSVDEVKEVAALANTTTHIIFKQGDHLRDLLNRGLLDNNRLVEMMQVLGRLYDCQGMCERIKNTTFPRQFTYFGRLFTWLFIILLPLALVDAFEAEAEKIHLIGIVQYEYVFLMVPFSTMISWLFYIMEKVSDSCEDPFEGGTTDVPISALTRTIEIDLLQMLGESDVPEPVQHLNGVLY